MKQKLIATLFAAILLAYIGPGHADAALEVNDDMSSLAKGNENLHPPDVMPPL